MFDRIAVVDPGEPAPRPIRAVPELDAEHGTRTRGSRCTEAERRATFVRAADEAVQPAESGRVHPLLGHAEPGRALPVSRADAVWVGWGSVAEDPAFAELCADLGVTFVGPPPEAMRLLDADIERARRVGSVHDVVPDAELRSRLTTAVERGTARAGAT